MRYQVRHISLRALALTGAAAGLLFSCLPALCVSTVLFGAIARAAEVLVSMRNFIVQTPDLEAFGLSVELPDLPVDLIARLGLEQVETLVLAAAAGAGLYFLLLVILLVLAGTLVLATFALLWGALFNFLAPWLGGMEVELQPAVDDRPVLPG